MGRSKSTEGSSHDEARYREQTARLAAEVESLTYEILFERNKAMITRQKPEGAPDEAWEEFNQLADDQAIGEHEDDWSIFWDFFIQGWYSREPNITIEEEHAEASKEPRSRSAQRSTRLGTRQSRSRAKAKRNGKSKPKKKSR